MFELFLSYSHCQRLSGSSFILPTRLFDSDVFVETEGAKTLLNLCEGVYKPHTAEQGVKEQLWVLAALPSHSCRACTSQRQGYKKGSRAAQRQVLKGSRWLLCGESAAWVLTKTCANPQRRSRGLSVQVKDLIEVIYSGKLKETGIGNGLGGSDLAPQSVGCSCPPVGPGTEPR